MGGIGDFATGAVSCPDGKSIIVIESVTKNGKYSKIVPYFEPGTPVSLSRTMVEYVVSEYGIAVLAGKSVQERARELVNIAHPAFRGGTGISGKGDWNFKLEGKGVTDEQFECSFSDSGNLHEW